MKTGMTHLSENYQNVENLFVMTLFLRSNLPTKILKIRRAKTFNLIIAWIPITIHTYNCTHVFYRANFVQSEDITFINFNI